MFGMFSLEPISHRGEIIETCHKLHLYATPLLISLCTLMTDTCTRLSFALLCLNSADMNFSLKYELFGIEGIPTGVVGYITISLSLSLSLSAGKNVCAFEISHHVTHTHTHLHTLHTKRFIPSLPFNLSSIHPFNPNKTEIRNLNLTFLLLTLCNYILSSSNQLSFSIRFDTIGPG